MVQLMFQSETVFRKFPKQNLPGSTEGTVEMCTSITMGGNYV
jgi:hypothetical protein